MKISLRASLAAALLLSACGGGGTSSYSSSTGGSGGGSTPPPPALNPPPTPPLVRVSGNSPFAAGCGGMESGSISYEDAEVEPYVAANPSNTSNLVGVWQQDRWSDGGAHGLMAGSSMDGGKHWTIVPLVFSVCAGGNNTNNADYARASDPWVSISPDGVAYATSISFTDATPTTTPSSSVLVSRSTDGGVTWGTATTLILDGSSSFNDKESITADPHDSNFVYDVWDRLTGCAGPAYYSRTTDGGTTWASAQALYDPGLGNQTIGNEVVGLSGGTIADVFEEIDNTCSNAATATIRVVLSSDHGATWSAPITVAQNLSVGTSDPDTGNPVRTGAGLPQMTAGPGNELVVVWQDARFNGGQWDGILASRSLDGGHTWSTPAEINAVPSVPAFTPSVAVMPDGTVGVSYFDFRNNTSDPSTLPTDYWFVSSGDFSHWSEKHISGSFNLDLAPDAEGLFIGDYQALAVIGRAFVPFFVQTNDQSTANRNDTFVLPPQAVPLTFAAVVNHVVAASPQVAPPDAAFRARVHQNLMRLLRSENPHWDAVRAQHQQTSSPP